MTTKSVKEGWDISWRSSSSRFRFNNLQSYYKSVLRQSKKWPVLFKNYENDIKKYKDDNPNFTNDDLDNFYEEQLNKKVRGKSKRDILKGLAWNVIKNKLSRSSSRNRFYDEAIDYVGSQLNLQHRI